MKKIVMFIGLITFLAVLSGCNSEESNSAEEKMDKNYFYIPNSAEGTISVIDPSKAETIDTISLGTEQASHGIALSLDGNELYTGTGFSAKSVLVIDTKTKEKRKEVKFDEGVHGIDLSPNGRYLYVSLNPGLGGEGGSLAIIKIENMEIIANVKTDNGPAHVAVTPSGSQVWVANVNGNSVSVINTQTNELIKTIAVGDVPNEVVITPDEKWAYVANVESDLVTVINVETLEAIKTIKAGDGPHGVTVSPNGKELWVSNNNSNDITVIDTQTLTTKLTIPTGSYANHVAFSIDGKWAYVTNRQSNDVLKINAENKEVTSKIQVGSEPHEISLEDYVSSISEPIEYTFEYASESTVSPTKGTPENVSLEERTRTTNANGVEIQALRLLPTDDTDGSKIDFEKYEVFQLNLTTHSGDLSSLNLDKNTFLVDERSKKQKPSEWVTISNDAHHPVYLVTYPKIEAPEISLKIENLDKEPVILIWNK